MPKHINYMLEVAKGEDEVKMLSQKIMNKLDGKELALFYKSYQHEISYNGHTNITYPNKQDLYDLLDTRESKNTYTDMLEEVMTEVKNLHPKHYIDNSIPNIDRFKIFLRLHRLNNAWYDVAPRSIRQDIGSIDIHN
jgi:hypothetical protein